MSFRFSSLEVDQLPPELRMIEDRRNNPVRNRDTKFRLLQQNILQYTYPMMPGFATAGIDRLPFKDLIEQSRLNAESEGEHLYGSDFEVSSNAVAKVAGDIFEEVEAAVHWSAAASWNYFMTTGTWSTGSTTYRKPVATPSADKQVAVLSLPRRYDWVRLLDDDGRSEVAKLRARLSGQDLTMPTSTPDLLVVQLPKNVHDPAPHLAMLPDVSLDSQAVLDLAYKHLEGKVPPEGFLLGVAFKKSLRSDRLYQPLYEANVMQLLLEGLLGAPRVEFEVHTLDSVGTRAEETYRAASLGLVATRATQPHSAIRALYEPPNAADLVKRFLTFLDDRFQ